MHVLNVVLLYIHPSHIDYISDNVNIECNHESAIHNSGNVVIVVWWDFQGVGHIPLSDGKREKKNFANLRGSQDNEDLI